MSRLDVLRSFVRAAGAKLDTRALRVKLAHALADATLARIDVPDVELTRAVARGRDVAAATVTSEHGAVRVEVSTRNGESLGLTFVPEAVRFAPGGAKEIAFRVDPPEAIDREAGREAFAMLGTVIAETLWRPALAGATSSGGASAFVTRDGDRLVLDLRTVPSIRAASRNRLGLAILETLDLKALEPHPRGLRLALGIHGMR